MDNGNGLILHFGIESITSFKCLKYITNLVISLSYMQSKFPKWFKVMYNLTKDDVLFWKSFNQSNNRVAFNL